VNADWLKFSETLCKTARLFVTMKSEVQCLFYALLSIHFVAIFGQFLTFGSNAQSQLGHGEVSTEYTILPVLNDQYNITQLSTTYYHTLIYILYWQIIPFVIP
jgi:hypothetical protein